MKCFLFALLLIPSIAFGQATRDVQKKASRQTANVETISADKTLTYLDAETQLLTPSGADRTVNLPSANVWKNWTVKIVNEDASYNLIVKSSSGTTLETIRSVGQAEFVARQDTPTGATHWTNLSKVQFDTPYVSADLISASTSCNADWSGFVQTFGTPDQAGRNVTYSFGSDIHTLTFGDIGWYRVTFLGAVMGTGNVPQKGMMYINTWGGTATKYTIGSESGYDYLFIVDRGVDGSHAYDATGMTSFLVKVTAASQTLTFKISFLVQANGTNCKYESRFVIDRIM